MKDISKTQASLSRNIRGQNPAEIAKEAQKIRDLYKATDATWEKHQLVDAVKMSAEVQSAADKIAKAASGYDFGTATTQFEVVAKSCKSCHDTHRERLPDGTYRLKQ
jgi:cytochrome c556